MRLFIAIIASSIALTGTFGSIQQAIGSAVTALIFTLLFIDDMKQTK